MPQFDSRLEKTFALRLTALVKSHKIKAWRRAVKMTGKAINDTFVMRKTPKATYTPDFFVTTNEGDTIIIEVKGGNPKFWRASRINFLWAVTMNPHLRFIVYKQKDGVLYRYYDLNETKAIMPEEMK
jgi:predicted nuclease of restriction endonuclease-like RecB superfamily